MKEKFCLDSVSSFKQINKASTNNSKTKQTFSFSRTNRFDPVKLVCEKSTYGGDYIQHRKQGTGIGYGSRSDFTKCVTVSPSSSKYLMHTQFDNNKSKRKGNSMGIGRDQVKFNQYISKQAIKVPPSTLYPFEKVTNKYDKSPSFSLRKRTKVLDRSITIDPQQFNPGPGSYSNHQGSKISKFASITYGTSRTRRFDSSDNKIPGAGQYDDTIQLSKIGKYSNSKYKGGTQARFNRSSRATFIDEQSKFAQTNYGPSFYRMPSQFGQYDGNVYGGSAINNFASSRRR